MGWFLNDRDSGILTALTFRYGDKPSTALRWVLRLRRVRALGGWREAPFPLERVPTPFFLAKPMIPERVRTSPRVARVPGIWRRASCCFVHDANHTAWRDETG